MGEGPIKKVISKLNEALGIATRTEVLLNMPDIQHKTKTAIGANPKISNKIDERWLTTSEVSALLNLPRKTVLNHIHLGRVTGRGMGRTFVVRYTDLVDAYGKEFMERGLNRSIKPKFYKDPRRNSNRAGTQVLKAGYMTKDRVIQELNDKVGSLTSEVEKLRDRVSSLTSENAGLIDRLAQ